MNSNRFIGKAQDFPENKSCRDKKRYKSEQQARGSQRGHRLKTGRILDAYQCRYCRYWHLGRHKGYFTDAR